VFLNQLLLLTTCERIRCMSFPSLRVIGVFAALFIARSVSAQTPEFRAVWADAWGGDFTNSTKADTLLNNVRAGNLNAIIMQARRRGDAFYQSNYEPTNPEIAPGFDPLGYLIQEGHNTNGGKKKVEIHAWMVTYHIWKGFAKPTDPTHPLNLHPEWLLKDSTGTNFTGAEYTFDPGHPEVQRHTYNVAMDMVTNYNVDGINFDYVRYSGISEGYNDVTVARFNRLYGRSGQPLAADADWKQFRRDQVTALVRKVYLNAIAARPEVKVSADTITWAPGPTSDSSWYSSSAAWNSVLQDWRGWMEEGIIDINVPMNYFRQWTHLNDFQNWSTFAKNRRFNRHLVNGPGIYLNSVADAIWQMRYSRTPTTLGNVADGACGYSYKVTNKDNVSTAAFMNALVNPSQYDTNATPLYATWVPTPEMSWKTTPTNGHLKGYLSGQTANNFLDGGTVTISGPINKTMKSDATGFYGAVDLVPGSYTASASFPGFAIYATNFTITAGVVRNVDIILPPSDLTIIDHPASQSVNVGTNVTFTVNAAGVPPLFFQWRLNGTNLSGELSSQLNLLNVDQNDDGSYSVIVSNITGSIVSSNALLVVRVPPNIVTQPQGISTNQGVDVTFSVAATGTAPLTYQWRKDGTSLVGATQDTYTRFNVQPSDQGSYSVVISNPAGSTTSGNAALTVSGGLVGPTIITQPQSRQAYAGQTATFRVRANGSLPFSYQWRSNGTPIAGAAGSQLTFSELDSSKAGDYSVTVSNSVSGVLSSPATLTVLPTYPVGGLEPLYKLAPGARPYLGTGSTERGIAYNPVTGNLLVVSRAQGTKICVLDAETGTDLYTMNTTGVSGGTYALNMIGVADDGVVYACNLATTASQFKIYRWENDDPATPPTVVFSGDPAGVSGERWGDSFDVRRSGKDTQLLVGARNTAGFCLVLTTNGTTFTSRRIVYTHGGCYSTSFGTGDTVWYKQFSSLYCISFNFSNTTGTLTRTISLPTGTQTVNPVGMSPSFNLLGVIGIQTPDKFHLFDATGPAKYIAVEPFATDYANDNTVGAVDFADDRVYALDCNNGLMALRLIPRTRAQIQWFSLLPSSRRGFQTDAGTLHQILQGSSDLQTWADITNVIPTNGYFEAIDPSPNPPRFYRTK
jgi:uncharacterized lipoprotein YddW (UPF0748 family)